jgi:hypothetical protein
VEVLRVPKSDYGYNLTFTIKDTYGSSYSISGYTPSFVMYDPQSSTNVILTGSATVLSAGLGVCRYNVSSNAFLSTGTYLAEVELKIGTDKRESTLPFKVIVMDSP